MNVKNRRAVTFGTGLVVIALGAAAEVGVEHMPAPVRPNPGGMAVVAVPGPIEEEPAFPIGSRASFDGRSYGDVAVNSPGEEIGGDDEAGSAAAFSWSTAPVDPSSGDSREARDPLVVDPLLFEHKMSGPFTLSGDHFGASVAGDASWTVVGAPDQINSGGVGPGAVHLFARSGSAWIHEMALTCPATDSTCSRFGASVALDGEWLVVGAPGVSGTLTTGRVHIYRWNGSTFGLHRVLAAPPSPTNVLFGTSVAIDDPFLVVGAPGDDENGTNAGAVYLFWYTSGSWGQLSRHVASDGGSADGFGRAVSISGGTFVVGAPGADSTSIDNGAVYTFARGAVLWYEDDTVLLPPATISGYAHFGEALSVMGDRLLVGAPDDSYLTTEGGRAWLYGRTTSDSWSQLTTLYATDAFGHFGSSVSLGSGLAAIGASGSDRAVPDAGAVYFFVDDGGWHYEGATTAPDAHGGQLFGGSVALTPIGLIVGAEGDGEHGSEAGAAYSYKDADVIFADGFESGTTGAWSQT